MLNRAHNLGEKVESHFFLENVGVGISTASCMSLVQKINANDSLKFIPIDQCRTIASRMYIFFVSELNASDSMTYVIHDWSSVSGAALCLR